MPGLTAIKDVALPFFTAANPTAKRAWVDFAGMVVFLLVESAILVKISYNSKDLNNSLSEKDESQFYTSVFNFIALLVVAAPLFGISDYLQRRLALAWRQFITTRLLKEYFSRDAFYRFHTPPVGGGKDAAYEDVDARIFLDGEQVAKKSVKLLSAAIGKLANLFAFVAVLYAIHPGLIAFAFLYAAAGSLVADTFFGSRLRAVHLESAAAEAAVRRHTGRCGEFKEEVAMCGGEAYEGAVAEGLFATAQACISVRIFWEAALTGFVDMFSWSTALVPYLAVAPLYFRGALEFGQVSQTAIAFRVIQSSLSIVVQQQQAIALLLKACGRVAEVHDGLAKARERAAIATDSNVRETNRAVGMLHIARTPAEGDVLTVASLTLRMGARCLVEDLSLHVRAGTSLMIKGPSGSGKTSLLRAVAGLLGGDGGAALAGSVAVAPRAFFLSQSAYLCWDTHSLREQLGYPVVGGGRGLSKTWIDRFLSAVRLSAVVPTGGEDEKAKDGAAVAVDVFDASRLSLGERQRLVLGRLMARMPELDLAFLDEATAALDGATESACYELLLEEARNHRVTVVSVAHRPALEAYHDMVLELDGHGGWLIRKADSIQRPLA